MPNKLIELNVREDRDRNELVYRFRIPLEAFEVVDFDTSKMIDEDFPTIPERLVFLADLIKRYEEKQNGQN